MTAEVSVVVGVRNGGEALRPSLETVLRQDVELELIVVDDGSTDGSADLLAEMAADDGRLRLFRQPAAGLTTALRNGCEATTAPVLARHDVGDRSLPGRLRAQLDLLQREPHVTLVSCSASAFGPCGEPLFEAARRMAPEEATLALRRDALGLPHHGTAVFPADAYRRAGGYRTAFPVAQDWDLWLRLTELGPLAYVSERLYEFEVALSSISARRRAEQLRYLDLARRCAARREAGLEEQSLLEAAARWASGATADGSNAYFIGKCLLDRRDPRARAYLGRALRERPLRARAWMAYVLSLLLRERRA